MPSLTGIAVDYTLLKIHFIFSDSNEIRINKQVGHMLRTKLSHVNEGGVAAGLGALDSVYLVDGESCCKGLCPDVPYVDDDCCH